MPSLEREAGWHRSLIDDADAIIVGIGSGMSSAAGFNLILTSDLLSTITNISS